MSSDISMRRKTIEAGIYYLLMAIGFTIGMVYADPKLYVPGDAVATAAKILASGSLVRIGLAGNSLGLISFLLLANALYRLFKPVDEHKARLMVIFVVTGVAVAFLNLLNHWIPVLLLNNPHSVSPFEPAQVSSLVMIFMDMYKTGSAIALVFWSLWLFPLGWMVMKCGFIPRILGILLILGGVCYMADFLEYFFFPGFNAGLNGFLSAIEAISEVSFILWLLIKGVRGTHE